MSLQSTLSFSLSRVFSLGALVAVSCGTSSASAGTPRWTPESLTQHLNRHDGPNCFNATLAAAGYMDELTYVDEGEFSFYLETFCRRVQTNESPRAGDLVTYNGRPSAYNDLPASGILHGALLLSEGRILEKTSVNGTLFHRAENHDLPGVYQIKEKNLSAFTYIIDPSLTPLIRSYRCQNVETVRLKISALNSDSVAQQILRLRRSLETKSTAESSRSSPLNLADLKDEVTSLTGALGRSPFDERSLYELVVAQSLVGALDLALKESGDSSDPSFAAILEKLNAVCAMRAAKIRARTKDRRILRILDQNHEPGI